MATITDLLGCSGLQRYWAWKEGKDGSAHSENEAWALNSASRYGDRGLGFRKAKIPA